MQTKKIIVVDDDIELGDLVSSYLIDEGYDVHYQSSLAGIENILEMLNPSILILDVEIGKDDGITRAKSILQKFPLLSILFISSHTETPDIARGLTAGGVGYIRKPFDMPELQAYIERFATPIKFDDLIAEMGPYTLNLRTRELQLNNIFVKQLSRLEFGVLQALLEDKNQTVLYDVLAKKVWNKTHLEVEHTLNNVISKLRKVLGHYDGKINLQTIKYVGFRLLV